MFVFGASFVNVVNCCVSFCGSGLWWLSEMLVLGWSVFCSKMTSCVSIFFCCSVCTFFYGMLVMLIG